MVTLTPMKGNDLVAKIMAGERDFRGVVLKDFDLTKHEGAIDLKAYIPAEARDRRRQQLGPDPIDISGSDFSGLVANGFFFPHLRAENAILEGAQLVSAVLQYAYMPGINLRRADLWKASMSNSDLTGACFEDAVMGLIDLGYSRLANSRFGDTNLYRADFSYANLRGARGLGACSTLGYAFFDHTRVTSYQRRLISAATHTVEKLVADF